MGLPADLQPFAWLGPLLPLLGTLRPRRSSLVHSPWASVPFAPNFYLLLAAHFALDLGEPILFHSFDRSRGRRVSPRAIFGAVPSQMTVFVTVTTSEGKLFIVNS